uniref:PAX-interacting protein 1 n=1 Tax=Denticeps clupeoides TaxID=299321 RepID=A0AAY4C949_9TELE
MSDEQLAVPDELFKDVKFYVVGDIDQKAVQLLKAGKGKEVSYNALATHIIAVDGDSPEVGESREVFDLPVVKVSEASVAITGFSPESGQLFFGVTACLPKVSMLNFNLSALWALITFHGGDCQLAFNKKCTHLIVPEPKGNKYEHALKHSSIKIVTPEWIIDTVKDKCRKDEALYHPRLTYLELEEEDEEEYDNSEDEYSRGSHSDGSYSDRRSPRSRRSSRGSSRDELMFDDSDDSSPEKEDRNLNWTPAEVPQPGVAKRCLQPGKETGLINLCATMPPVPGLPCTTGPPDGRDAVPTGGVGGPDRPEGMAGWNPATRTLRNITNNTDMQQANRVSNVAHILQGLTGTAKPLEQQGNQAQSGIPNPVLFNQMKPQVQSQQQPITAEAQQLMQQQQHQQQPHHPQQMAPQHPILHLQPQAMQLHHPQQQQQQQQIPQQGFPQLPPQQQQQQQHAFLQQQTHQQQMHRQLFNQQQQQQHTFSQQQMRPQQLLRPPLQQQQLQQQQQHALQQMQQMQQQRLQLQLQQQQQQNQQQMHQQHFLQQQQLQQQHMQQLQQQQLQQQQHLQNQQPLQHQPGQSIQHQTTLQPPQPHQLFGHEPGQESKSLCCCRGLPFLVCHTLTSKSFVRHLFFPINQFSLVPEDGFLVGCVFTIADYPEQMADKQLLATWKKIIQSYAGTVDSSLSNRCTHLLCESQVSSMYVQALREGKRCVTAHWLNTVLKKKKMIPPHRTLHLPFAFPPGTKPCSQHIISVTGFVDTDRDDLKLMAYLAGARYTGYLCRSNTVLICKEPTGLKYEKAKEWRIPCVNAQWLCDILLGNFEALRQVQHTRYAQFNLQEPLVPNQHLVQNLLGAWRTSIKVSPDTLVVSFYHNVFQSRLIFIELPTPTKKLPPESTPCVFFTGFEPPQVQQHVKRLYDLGGEVVDSAQKCTHLVANKVTRTVKFLTAVSTVKHIVTSEWLEESWKSQKFVDEQNYMLRDAEAEVLFCFSLEESLKRAHTAPLFKGKYFYITPGICPSLSTMKAIVESAGGKLLAKQPSFRKIMEHKQNKHLPEIILISCENDLHLCREYFLKNIDVHNAEFVLTGVLTQNLDYESYPFLGISDIHFSHDVMWLIFVFSVLLFINTSMYHLNSSLIASHINSHDVPAEDRTFECCWNVMYLLNHRPKLEDTRSLYS